MNNKVEIPEGLGELLRDFTVHVLRDRPPDIYDFAAQYFVRVAESRRISQPPMYVVVDGEVDGEEAADLVGEPDPALFAAGAKSMKSRFPRRKSVAAERYDPEQDGEDGFVCRVHPKTEVQRARLLDAVRGILLFKALDADQMTSVINAMFERRVTPGENVIVQGDDGDNFYVIESGTFHVFQKTDNGEQRQVCEFTDRGFFGELALMYNQPRAATVTAVTDGTLWAMDRDSFRRIVLRSAFIKRRHYEQLLDTVPLLGKLELYERMNLADALVPKTYTEGDCIIREGDPADGMYFIEEGRVRVTVTQAGHEVQAAEEAAGQYFGEMALLENMPRSATVYALGTVKVAFLERDSFERLLGPCMEIMKRDTSKYLKSS